MDSKWQGKEVDETQNGCCATYTFCCWKHVPVLFFLFFFSPGCVIKTFSAVMRKLSQGRKQRSYAMALFFSSFSLACHFRVKTTASNSLLVLNNISTLLVLPCLCLWSIALRRNGDQKKLSDREIKRSLCFLVRYERLSKRILLLWCVLRMEIT